MYAVFALTLLVAVAALPAEKKYDTKYDGVDLDEIIKNERLFNGYYKCIISKGDCTPDGEMLKQNIPDALATNCSKCSDKQKAGSQKIIKYLIEKKPEQYKVLEEKFDPTGKYRKNLEKFGKN